MEGMAAGLPLLVMDFEGVETLVTHERTGLVAHDEGELLTLARKLVTEASQRERMGEEGRQRILDGFALEGLAERFEAAVS
jgi:glycosyltransferase involved in cell wall biosynthesis